MIADVDENDSNSIEFSEFLQVMARQKLEAEDTGKERDIMDAWLAVGGGQRVGGQDEGGQNDTEGFVDADLLIKIIKHDFCLNIDIEVRVLLCEALLSFPFTLSQSLSVQARLTFPTNPTSDNDQADGYQRRRKSRL